MRPAPVRYSIVPVHPEAHLFEVACTVHEPDPAGQRFVLPAWIPGSYMIREFAKHVVRVAGFAGGKKVKLVKLDKHTWQAAPVPGPLTVRYEVYAWDLSVRGAHLDTTHGFFNGTSVFLSVVGQEERPCLVDIQPPRGKAYAAWRVATTLPEAKGEKGAAKRYGFGLYRAADYDALIDHPVEMGTFTLASFKACGVPHDIAITGRHDCDTARLCRDLKRVCEWQIRLFGEPAPMDRYLFLVTAVGEGYGGLEHRSSTALLCARGDLPGHHEEEIGEAYRGFLGLCSHEYFHTWNVKRIKPAVFLPYDLSRETYTPLLWAFEGITSYYDDLALVRSRVISPREYLTLVGKTLTAVQRGSGRRKQSVAESSFDAWIKYYRQDENAPNAVVSYYAKGALIALALDLTLRQATKGKVSLDDVMRTLWRDFGQAGRGVEPEDIRHIAEALSGLRLGAFFRNAVEGTADLPLAGLLARFGITLAWEAAGRTPSLGAKWRAEGGETRLSQVVDGGPAQAAGLSAGDVLVALDGLRIGAAGPDKLLARRRPGETVRIHAFRRDELMEFELTLAPPERLECRLSEEEKPGAAALALRRGWLGSG